jgi:hypothetical protein
VGPADDLTIRTLNAFLSLRASVKAADGNGWIDPPESPSVITLEHDQR